MSYFYFENKKADPDNPNKIIPYSNIIAKFVNKNDNKPMYLFRIKINSFQIINQINTELPLINCILAIKFLSFSVIKFECNYYAYQKKIEVNNEKNIFFEYQNSYELRELLRNKPLYIILINKNTKQIICSTNLNISWFSQDFFLNYKNNEIPPPAYKKEIYLLNNNIPICKGEISLLVRREYYEYYEHYEEDNLFKLNIPVQSISDKKILIPSYFLSENNKKQIEINNKKINFDIEKKIIKQKEISNNDNFNIFEFPKYSPSPIYYYHNYKVNPDIYNDNTFSSLANEIKNAIPIFDNKIKEKEKDNKLYIEIPPRFPKDKIESNLPKKELDVINYDELMKKTFHNIYKK